MLHVTQVLPFLTHADADVRGHATKYVSDLGDAAPAEAADELWKAIDLFGDLPTDTGVEERERFLAALRNIPQKDSTIARAIDLLNHSESDEGSRDEPGMIFVQMPLDQLQPRQAEILKIVQPEHQDRIRARLALRDLSGEQLWTQLLEFAKNSEGHNDVDTDTAHDLYLALAKYPDDAIPQAMAVLEDPLDRQWLEIWCTELLGHLRHAPAIDLLIQKMQIEDADYLRESAAKALGRMPAESVVAKLEAVYNTSEDPFQRAALADTLGHVKDPLAEAALLRILPSETSDTARTGVCMGLIDLCTTDGLEQIRQVVIDNRYDRHLADLKEMLITLSVMTGYAPPELEEWKLQLKDPVYREKLRDQFLSTFGMDPNMVKQFRSYLAGNPIEETQKEETQAMPRQLTAPSTIRRTDPKIGRNDPCPCGSGKKYKKCCGR